MLNNCSKTSNYYLKKYFSFLLLTTILLLLLFNSKITSAQGISTDGYNVDPIIIGSSEAKVEIMDFSSLTCPYCGRYHTQVLPKLLESYLDNQQVRFVFFDFPLDRLAFAASIITRCNTGSRRKKLIDVMYNKQSTWTQAKDQIKVLTSYANLFGVTNEQIEKCFKDEKIFDKINSERKFGAEKYGVNSTPSLYVNDEYVKTASYEVISKMVEDALR